MLPLDLLPLLRPALLFALCAALGGGQQLEFRHLPQGGGGRGNNWLVFVVRLWVLAQGGSGELDGMKQTTGEEAPVEGATGSKPHPTSYPKVLITVRSELLSGTPGYRSHFLPLESQNQDKDEEHEDPLEWG